MATVTDRVLTELADIVGEINVVTHASRLDRNSRDAFWYSPVLKPQLEHKKAEVMIQPASVEQLLAVIKLAVRERIPITPRGAGTGNYGQSVPIHGGILISTRQMNRILEITPEFAHVEAGVILYNIEMAAREIGAELRFFPSTLPTATAGGFLAGGSAGLGSIMYGNLWDHENVPNATIITIEDKPKVHHLTTADEMQAIIHNCGLTSIITSLTFALAPAQHWHQYVVSFPDFTSALRFGKTLAFDDSVGRRLVAVHEWPIPSFFTQLVRQDGVIDGHSAVLVQVPMDKTAFDKRVAAAGGQISWYEARSYGHKDVLQLSDFSWNHTTLWAMKADPQLTYLQDGFISEQVDDQIAKRKARFGDDVIEHITFSRTGGEIITAGLTLVRYQSDEQLQAVMDYSESIGIRQYSPHTTYLDEDPRWNGQPILDAKARWDPYNILNPGHLKVLEEQD